MTSNELDNALPEYLVFLILTNISKLRDLSPDHILVKAVEEALTNQATIEAIELRQLAFDF
jgi:hypothetical protein